mmetsp:Transcript_9623/g.17496  ORF Transcript_9623/g.17496 Transcript_9623/m.17496 type:complete len:351 (+) Transcript_9623:255-1307(+)|eukprot:CAMPEP_0202505608 /NCGR_PEP_ID=MMETSP1361-20130828/47652_1 /ASSEMBLY_ACC=CAM_ASM_000849 /TAXON_ID=210615 /ORGANISM="Staurosira complex sp., Strain CCMP2646" /LENGTH=350 /DNA_ID=CAMNT_0049139369 /DNA_START=181 /DNA_END=1233 /DNA_ORIENTATION=+
MKHTLFFLSFILLLETPESLQPLSKLHIYNPTTNTISNSRRGFLSTGAASAFGTLSLSVFPTQHARAVEPLTSEEADAGIGGGVTRKLRPPSKDKVPRQKLALDFAVMLTRSSYIEAAQLEIVPVNQLERDMYLVRTSEYQPYVKATEGAVKQGDLTDPFYFDFMCAVQYLTINRALQDPQKDFEQLEPIQNEDGTQSTEFRKVSIRRTLPDNLLIPTYEARVGATILSFLNDRFKDSEIGLLKLDTPRPGTAAMLQTFSQLLNLFLINGFAWEGKAELVSEKADGSPTFRFLLRNPATLWSSKCLANAPVRNDYLRKTAVQLAKSMGYTVASSSVKLEGNSECTYLKLK